MTNIRNTNIRDGKCTRRTPLRAHDTYGKPRCLKHASIYDTVSYCATVLFAKFTNKIQLFLCAATRRAAGQNNHGNTAGIKFRLKFSSQAFLRPAIRVCRDHMDAEDGRQHAQPFRNTGQNFPCDRKRTIIIQHQVTQGNYFPSGNAER